MPLVAELCVSTAQLSGELLAELETPLPYGFVGHDHARDRETLWQTVQEQAGQVARKLQAEGLTGTTVKLKLRWADFTTLTRQTSVGPTGDEVLVTQAAGLLLDQVWEYGRRVRLIGVGVSGLEDRAHQLSLFTLDPE